MTFPEDGQQHDASGSRRPSEAGRTSWLVRILMFVLLAAGAYYVIAEHGAHLLGAWPLLLLLACIPMHLMHSGHGAHARHRRQNGGQNEGDGNG